MLSLDTAVIVLAGIALFAAFVNGALGYGFSSLTVPVALVFYASRLHSGAQLADGSGILNTAKLIGCGVGTVHRIKREMAGAAA